MPTPSSRLILTFFLLLISLPASAELKNHGVLDQVISSFATRTSAWQGAIMDAASWLFWTLGTISLTWTAGMMILRKADIGEFFVEFTRFILFFGFWLWLLRNGPDFAISILKSMNQLGLNASQTKAASPSEIIDIGFLIIKQAFDNSNIWQPVDSFVGVILSIGILVMLAALAVNIVLIFVSGWFLAYAGIFFLGFGGSRWTSEIAANYYRAVLGIAIQLMCMILLIGIGNDLLTDFYSKMNRQTLNFEELAVMLVVCLTLLLLTNKVPPLVAGILTGSSLTAGNNMSSFTAGTIVGSSLAAASMAGTGMSMAGSSVMGALRPSSSAQTTIAAAMADNSSQNNFDQDPPFDVDAFYKNHYASKASSSKSSSFGQTSGGPGTSGSPNSSAWNQNSSGQSTKGSGSANAGGGSAPQSNSDQSNTSDSALPSSESDDQTDISEKPPTGSEDGEAEPFQYDVPEGLFPDGYDVSIPASKRPYLFGYESCVEMNRAGELELLEIAKKKEALKEKQKISDDKEES